MLEFLDGATRLHLIIGDPVAQTKSPAGLTREFQARKVNAICVPLHVAPADFDAVMAAAKKVRNIDGIVITMPHKFAALAHCDETSERTRILGAVNLLRPDKNGRWSGDMTDGTAMVAALQRAGCEPRGKRALVVGAGGAGSAVALALIESGAAGLVVADVDASRRDDLVRRLAPRGAAVTSAEIADAAGCQIIINATPAGMKPTDPLPLDVARLDANAVVGDLITKPVVTPLLEAARQRGCTVVTGEDMFAVQAGYMADILLAPR